MPRPKGYRNSRDELTARQREVLLLLVDHLLAHQRPPTRREVGALLGGSNRSNANCLLRALEHKGYVELDDAQPCGVRIVGACLTLLCPATPEGQRLRRALGAETLPPPPG